MSQSARARCPSTGECLILPTCKDRCWLKNEPLLIGRRIKLIEMPHDPSPLEPGSTGTIWEVRAYPGWTQIAVEWDNGSGLMLCVPPDKYELTT